MVSIKVTTFAKHAHCDNGRTLPLLIGTEKMYYAFFIKLVCTWVNFGVGLDHFSYPMKGFFNILKKIAFWTFLKKCTSRANFLVMNITVLSYPKIHTLAKTNRNRAYSICNGSTTTLDLVNNHNLVNFFKSLIDQSTICNIHQTTLICKGNVFLSTQCSFDICYADHGVLGFSGFWRLLGQLL